MSLLFKKRFLVDYPLMWAFIVFLLVEISLIIIEGGDYFERAIDFPIKFAFTMIVKLLIFVLLAFGYARYAGKK